jgi:ankyrin repeat protein
LSGDTMVGMELLQAALNGDVTEIRRLVANGRNVNERDADGDAALHYAALNGHVEAIKALVQLGADKDAKTVGGQTPLHWAAQNGHVEAIKALEQLGAQIDVQAANGETPLKTSIRVGHHQAAQVLRELERTARARKEAAEQAERTAAGRGSVETTAAASQRVVEALLAGGANVEALGGEGHSPLSWAAQCGDLEVVNALLAGGANVEAPSSDGRSPLSWAARLKRVEVVNALVAAGANVEALRNDEAKWAKKQAKHAERNKETADKEAAEAATLAAAEEVHYPTLPLRVEQRFTRKVSWSLTHRWSPGFGCRRRSHRRTPRRTRRSRQRRRRSSCRRNASACEPPCWR